MTITSANRKAGPFLGDGVTTAFPFTFKVFKKEDVTVTFTGVSGVDSVLVLDSDYSVTLNTDQDNNPGGTITYPRVGSPVAVMHTGEKVTLTGGLAYTQPTDLPNLSPWFPEVVEDALDRAEIQIQQLKEITDRSIKISVSDTPLTPLPSAPGRANMLIGFDALGNVTVVPEPSSIGAGDRIPFTLVAGADFIPGIDTQVTLPRAPGAPGNLEVNFDGVPQDFAEWTVAGTVLTFAQPIPAFITKVWGYVGTTLSTEIPPSGSVTDDTVSASAGIQSSKLSYEYPAASAVARTVQSRLQERASVMDFGATGDGSDATNAFSAAAKGAAAAVEMQGAMATGIARAPIAHVHVPAGTYVISSVVDTGGRDVQWHFDSGAVVTGYANLPGKIIRDHQRIGERHYGASDYATSLVVRSGDADFEQGAQVMGATSPAGLGVYPDRDSVTVFIDNTAPAADVDIASANYTPNTIAPAVALTADQVKNLRVGMMIDTKHGPTKYTGFITGWAANGTSITVSGWYLSPGPGTPATPANGTGAYVNPITKIWAINANVHLPPTALANRMVGFELGLLSGKPGAVDPYDSTLATWGYDAVNLGSARSSALFIARGDAWHGYRSEGQVIGYAYKGANAVMEARALSGDVFFTIAQGGSMEVGLASSANTPSIDFHSSGSAVNDYDARVVSTGGTGGVNGQANLLLQAAFVETGVIRPDGDNTRSCGESGKRWSVVYAATGSINTSDAREKTAVRPLSEAEIAAARQLASEIGAYQWLSSVDEKGAAAARQHIGMTVQRAIEIMTSHGLDPMAYGFICYDQWGAEDAVVIHHPAKEAVIDKPSGNVLEPAVAAWDEEVRAARPAGDLYSFRADQLTLFIARGMEARLSALEATLNIGA